jgi:hypothetical protein
MNYERKRYLTDKLADLLFSRQEQLKRHPVPGDFHGHRLREEIEALQWALTLARENQTATDVKYG